MMREFVPRTEAEAAQVIADCARQGTALDLGGNGTRGAIGNPVAAGAKLTTRAMAGILDYNPAEMVMTARAGTPVAEIERELAANGQMMAFEPLDHSLMMGTQGIPTIGGAFAVNASGPRRLSAGAARDHLLGIRFVNGAGEVVKAGGRVMKNVTGLDLVKLLAGSHGTLGLLTEVTFKVLPRPRAAAAVVLALFDEEVATQAMAAAMALPVEVSGAAHLPEGVRSAFLGGTLPAGGATVFRIEGLEASVKVRAEKLAAVLSALGPVLRLGGAETATLWREIRDVAPFAEDGTLRPLWRVSVAPTEGHALVAALRQQTGVNVFYDWQGGLVWMRMEADPEADLLRGLIRRFSGGHATLMRAADAVRMEVPAFEPLPAGVAALSARVKASCDPRGIFNPGRMAPLGTPSGMVAGGLRH